VRTGSISGACSASRASTSLFCAELALMFALDGYVGRQRDPQIAVCKRSIFVEALHPHVCIFDSKSDGKSRVRAYIWLKLAIIKHQNSNKFKILMF